ncbi:MAG: hypothetical protein K2O44_00740 [Clostridia bacterium]|nr:hypothetical protein [Clostridia bacterium]
MINWELARYLIDAKKDVDSIYFIAENLNLIVNIGVKEKVSEKQREFYVNCCTVIDNSFPKKKKYLCDKDEIVKRIYYERDKNYAHKDYDYKPREFNNLFELVKIMRAELVHLREICKHSLPKEVTLDFVPHDKELFRFINGLTAEKEEEIKKKKYPKYIEQIPINTPTITKKIFYDTEEIRNMTEEEKDDYAVIMENGLNSFEGVQNRQDACIKINVLCNKNFWMAPNFEVIKQIQELKKYGFVDQYEILQFQNLQTQEQKNKFNTIISRGKV